MHSLIRLRLREYCTYVFINTTKHVSKLIVTTLVLFHKIKIANKMGNTYQHRKKNTDWKGVAPYNHFSKSSNPSWNIFFKTKTAKNVKKNFENTTPKKIFTVNISLNWKAPIIRHRLITRLRAVISLPFFLHLYFCFLYFFLSFSFFCLYACVLFCNCLSLWPSVYLQNQWIS